MKLYKTRVFAWSLYDFANTIFSMNVVSLYFPLMIKNVYNAPDIMLSLARSVSMIFVALCMPLAGVVADKYKRRMPFAILFTILCCAATMLMSQSGQLGLDLALFGIALFCYQAALVFYNATLSQVAEPSKLGRVSGYGVALGYVGTIFGLTIIGLLTRPQNYFQIFPLTAALFMVFSIPFFLLVRDQSPLPLKNIWASFIDAIKNISSVYRDAQSRPGVLRFLLAQFFIVEAVETIIFFMGIFLKEAGGFSDSITIIGNLSEITFYLIIVTIFTAIGSYFWGFINEKIGPKNSMRATVLIWIVTLTGVAVISNKAILYILGSLAGIALGGTWTSERPLFINLVGDNTKLAGYFGLFALCGRTAAVIGPIIWGLIVLLFEGLGAIKYRFAVSSLILMMIAGFIILQKVPDAREKIA